MRYIRWKINVIMAQIEKEEGGLRQGLQDLLMAGNAHAAGQVRKVVLTGCAVNALLMLMKVFVGYFGHSTALVADGFHSLNDVAVDIVMLLFVGISYRGANSRYVYGYGKYETFSSMLISILMVFIGIFISIEAIENIVDYTRGEELMHPDIWTIVAVLVAMGCKEGLYRYYSQAGRRLDSTALRTAGWHHRLDAMSSTATLAGVTLAHFMGKAWSVADPAVSLAIGVLIVVQAIRLLRPAFNELMEVSLDKEDLDKAQNAIESVKGVEEVIMLKARRSGHNKIFDIKVKVNPTHTIEQGKEVVSGIRQALSAAFCPHIFVTVELE